MLPYWVKSCFDFFLLRCVLHVNYFLVILRQLIDLLYIYIVFFCRWWKDLDVPTKFPFARDRIVECYFWTLGAYFEPQYNVGRKMLTKVIAISSILDDIYDAYGTFEELQVLAPAIQRLFYFIIPMMTSTNKSFCLK